MCFNSDRGMRVGLKALPHLEPSQWRIFFGLGTGASSRVSHRKQNSLGFVYITERLGFGRATLVYRKKKEEINTFVRLQVQEKKTYQKRMSPALDRLRG